MSNCKASLFIWCQVSYSWIPGFRGGQRLHGRWSLSACWEATCFPKCLWNLKFSSLLRPHAPRQRVININNLLCLILLWVSLSQCLVTLSHTGLESAWYCCCIKSCCFSWPPGINKSTSSSDENTCFKATQHSLTAPFVTFIVLPIRLSHAYPRISSLTVIYSWQHDCLQWLLPLWVVLIKNINICKVCGANRSLGNESMILCVVCGELNCSKVIQNYTMRTANCLTNK